MNSSVKNKFNNGWLGFSAGMLSPFLTLYVFYLVKYSHLSFRLFYQEILFANNIVTSSISLFYIHMDQSYA